MKALPIALLLLMILVDSLYSQDPAILKERKKEALKADSIRIQNIKTIVIGNLEVMASDLDDFELEFKQAEDACIKLNNRSTRHKYRWRLPNKAELNVLYEYKSKIGGFDTTGGSRYWSSTTELEVYTPKDGKSDSVFYKWSKNFRILSNQRQSDGEYRRARVRAVRTLITLDDERLFLRVIGKTVLIGHLEVMTKDTGAMDWYKADTVSAQLGMGWRMPSKDELKLLYENKDKIGGLANKPYWSLTSTSWYAWLLDFSNNKEGYFAKENINNVRAVKTISNKNIEVSNAYKIGKTIRLENIEVMSEDLGRMEFTEAVKASEAIGNGWRIPTSDELNVLFINKEKIGGFTSYPYWCAPKYYDWDSFQVFGHGLMTDYQTFFNRRKRFYVRLVRSISND